MIEPFLSAAPVLEKLHNAGFEAYFVGGSVRDFLLQKPIHDVDIATSATPKEMKEIFPKTVDVGIEHGTILVLYKGNSYEITTFRTEEEYIDFRRPKSVAFIRSLKDDLKRRDFTMNAIAMDHDGGLLDPFNGQNAIKEKRIQTVGAPIDRFREDALRMMRAVRFMSQLSFSIEKNTLQALSDLAYLLDKIAVERKKAEFEKLLVGNDRLKAIKLLVETNMYVHLPGLRESKDQISKFLSYKSDQLSLNEMWTLLIFCLELSGKAIEYFLRDWKLPIKKIKDIMKIVTFFNKRLEHDWSLYDLYLAKVETVASVERLFQLVSGLNDFSAVEKAVELYHSIPIKDRMELDVTGQDLMIWFKQSGGPWLNEMIRKIEMGIVEEKVENKKNKIKEWLLKCNQI